MAYDEHYSGSEPGPTAIDFVSQGVTDMMEYGSADQIVLGMPFYTRLWVTDGEKVSCSTIHMSKISAYLEKHGATSTWLEDQGQYYAEFTEDGKTYQIWIEDAESLAKKLQVMQTNQLAGCAFWKLTLENEEIWDVISQYM